MRHLPRSHSRGCWPGSRGLLQSQAPGSWSVHSSHSAGRSIYRCIINRRSEGPHGEGAERAHFGWHGVEFESLGGQVCKAGHVLDDGNFIAEENGVNGAMQISRVVAIIGINTIEFNPGVPQEL